MAKVLLIEDDDIMVSLLRTLLEIEGFEVAALDEKDDAVELIQRLSPDVVMLDVHLRLKSGQEVNGFDLLSRIRQQESSQDVKVIMSSGMDFREKSAEMGADGFILKPYMPNDLISLIKKTLS